MKGNSKGDQKEQNRMPNLKKSQSQKSENIKTSGSMKSGEIHSQHSEASLPDSSRGRRDGRKRMKKTISNKVYENMQSQDVSKVDDSNLQQINIDTSMSRVDNKQGQYNTLDFMSLNGLSEQTMNTQPASTFMGGAFKMSGGNSNKSNQQQQQQNLNGQKSNNSNISIQQQMNQHVEQQKQSITAFYASGDGAQMPRRVDNRNNIVIDLSQNQHLYLTPTSDFKTKLCKAAIALIFIAYLSFNVYMSFQQGSLENGQLRSRSGEDGKQENADEYYPLAREEMRKEVEDMRLFTQQIETCLISRLDFVKQYRRKDSFFDVNHCEWVKKCNRSALIYSNFCVTECPASYHNVFGTCQSKNSINNNNNNNKNNNNNNNNALINRCSEHFYQEPIIRDIAGSKDKEKGENSLFSCVECNESCFSCLSQNVCQICQTGYYLLDGTCVQTCNTSSLSNVNVELIEDRKSDGCVGKSNSNLTYNIFYIQSHVLQKRMFYEVIYNSDKIEASNNRQYLSVLYFINDRNTSITTLQLHFQQLSAQFNSFNNLILVSLPSVPDSLFRDTHFFNFFNQELIPQVEQHFPLPSSPLNRLIAGEGLGGLQAIYIASKTRIKFGFVGMINGFVNVTDAPKSIQEQLFFANEKIYDITFDFKKDFNARTFIYTDFSGFDEHSNNAEISYRSLLSKFKKDSAAFDIIEDVPAADSDCNGQNRDKCFQQRYLHFFQSIIKYNNLIKSEEEQKH